MGHLTLPGSDLPALRSILVVAKAGNDRFRETGCTADGICMYVYYRWLPGAPAGDVSILIRAFWLHRILVVFNTKDIRAIT